MTIVTRGPRERSWKFQDLASQETNRRWDSPIANSFRVEEPLSIQFIEPLCFYPSLLPPPPSSLRCPPPAPRLFRLTFPGYIPYSARVGIQRPHNRLLTHSIFLPYPLTRPLSAHPPFSLLSSLIRSFPLSLSRHLLPSTAVLAASSIGAGMRSSPFHGRETRLRRKGGVKGGGEKRVR